MTAFALLTPVFAQAQDQVTIAATPQHFTSGATITVNAAIVNQPSFPCYESEGCYILDVTPHIAIERNGQLWQEAYATSVSLPDGVPGQTMQASNYSVTGGYIYTYTWWFMNGEPAQAWDPGFAGPVSVSPTAVPSVIGVSPSTGSGETQTFTFQYSSSTGTSSIYGTAQNISAGTTANSCLTGVLAHSGYIELWNDAGTAPIASSTLGANVVLENSQCRVFVAGASASSSGNTLTVIIPLQFKPSYAGPKAVFAWASNWANQYSPTVTVGNWTVATDCAYQLTPVNATVPAAAGQVTFSVMTDPACGWTASGSSGFLTLVSSGSGLGSGQVSYAYTANASSSQRSGPLSVAGQSVLVTQIGQSQSLPGDEISYYHLDAIGSVRIVTNANGNIIRSHDFLPFGQEYLPPSGTEPVLFTGQERDSETTLDYFEARHYSAGLERFTSPDSLPLTTHRLLAPHTLNRYTYAANNPVRFVDPTGLDISCVEVPGIGVVCSDDVTVTAEGDLISIGNGCQVSPADLLNAESLDQLCPSGSSGPQGPTDGSSTPGDEGTPETGGGIVNRVSSWVSDNQQCLILLSHL